MVQKTAHEYVKEIRALCFTIRSHARHLKRGDLLTDAPIVEKCQELHKVIIEFNTEYPKRLNKDAMEKLVNMTYNGDYAHYMVDLQLLGRHKMNPNKRSYELFKDEIITVKGFKY